jgi:hypothetical protein
MKIIIDAMKLRKPAIAMGFQSIIFINNPAMLHKNAVAAIAAMPKLLFEFSMIKQDIGGAGEKSVFNLAQHHDFFKFFPIFHAFPIFSPTDQ